MSEFEPLDLRPGIPILQEGFWAERTLMDHGKGWEEAPENGAEDEGPRPPEVDGGHRTEEGEGEDVLVGRQTPEVEEVALTMI
eukprot:g18607.t1